MMDTTGPVHFLNIEYFMRLLYEAVTHASFSNGGIVSFLVTLWGVLIIFSIIFCLGCLGFFLFYTMRLYQTRQEEKPRYSTIDPAHASIETERTRWTHIKELIESSSQSDWRQAIIEADIMLEEVLRKQGLPGDNVGDMLRAANPGHFTTLRDAGEAHGVRNRIAHDGSAFELTDRIAYRTILAYENVFREFHEI